MYITLKKKLDTIRSLNKTSNTPFKRQQYRIPSVELLKEYNYKPLINSLSSELLEKRISDLGIETAVINIKNGPVITRYELKLAKGIRISAFKKLEEDIAMALATNSIRIQAPIPETSLIGIELANKQNSIVGLKNIFPNKISEKIPIILGTDTIGKPKIIDLVDMPHLLIAGQTGSGKSVCLNSIVISILLTKTPEECQLVLVDPKRIEMSPYKNLPHLKWPVVNETSEALNVFSSLIEEMERRFEVLEKNSVRNIESYNKKSENKMPYIVTIVDEMSDLIMTSGKELETMIVRIAQLARAVGIHLVLATQKPVVKVITGLIKSNMPSRISFKVTSKTDSRVIIDCNGAESLLGKGDMLMTGPGIPEPERYHGVWISDEEINNITNYIQG